MKSQALGAKTQKEKPYFCLLTVWLAPHATSRTTTLGTGRICPSLVFSMKMATRRGTSSQSYSMRCARAMNFPSELCPVGEHRVTKPSPYPLANSTFLGLHPILGFESCFAAAPAAFQHFMDGKTEAGSPPTPSHGSSNL